LLDRLVEFIIDIISAGFETELFKDGIIDEAAFISSAGRGGAILALDEEMVDAPERYSAKIVVLLIVVLLLASPRCIVFDADVSRKNPAKTMPLAARMLFDAFPFGEDGEDPFVKFSVF
jgi:hypothetical protein